MKHMRTKCKYWERKKNSERRWTNWRQQSLAQWASPRNRRAQRIVTDSRKKNLSRLLDLSLRFMMLQMAQQMVKALSMMHGCDEVTKSFSAPQLDVHLIGARHLPSNFGFKTVEGYIVKVCELMRCEERCIEGTFCRSSFFPAQPSSIHRFRRLHGQSSTKLFAFPWRLCTSNEYTEAILKINFSYLIALSALFSAAFALGHPWNRRIENRIVISTEIFHCLRKYSKEHSSCSLLSRYWSFPLA